MANVLNTIIKNSALRPIKYASKTSNIVNVLQSQVRFLYAKATLGIDTFIDQRARTQNQLSNITPKFKTKMNEYTSDDSKNMIFTEDLKNMVHIAENEDVDLVVRMIDRFNSQNKELRFGNFVFGPVVMRMFHHLNKPEEALQSFMSPNMQGFYDQLITYQILLDLLYENGKYQDILDTFNNIKERQIESSKYPRNIVVLTLAACYKLNTQASLDYALKLWTELKDIGHIPMRRAVTFAAGLALLQGRSEVALEMASSAKNQNYTTIRNLKVAALCDVGRLEDVIPILKGVLEQEALPDKKHTFNKDVMEKVNAAVEKEGNAEIQAEFKRIEGYLRDQGHICETTLSEQLCMEVKSPPFIGYKNRNQQQQQQPMRYNRYQRTGGYDNRQQKYEYRRPGLTELQ